MTTKTIQQLFNIGGVPADVTSVVLRDVTDSYGIRRTDTGAIVVAAGTAFTHVSTGVYSYQFTEPEAGLSYQYSIEWVYDGITHYKNQVLETGDGSAVPVPASSTYTQMGVDVVGCGDTDLSNFLATQANIVWAMQARRGVALDLQYQYYVSDLITLAMDHVRMKIDREIGSYSATGSGNFDALNTNDASSTTTKARTSSFTESSQSNQAWNRNSARHTEASSAMDASNSADRNASSSDTSYVTQLSGNATGDGRGHSIRQQDGSSHTYGSLNIITGKSGEASQNYSQGVVSTTKYEGKGIVSGAPPNISSLFTLATVIGTTDINGSSGVTHKVTPSVLGRISNLSGTLDPDGHLGNYASVFTSSSQHGRTLVGIQAGTGSSLFHSEGLRVNNRVANSVSHSDSAILGNSSSSMSSSSHEDQTRTASSASHSESAFNSAVVATAVGHRESSGSEVMTATGSGDREYYSQIFDSLKLMWEDTQGAIRQLEAQMMLTVRYLSDKLAVYTPQATLVGQIALPTSPTLVQRPGVFGGNVLGQTGIPFDRFIVR